MLIRVRHKTTYSYERPAQSVIQLLRLTPRNHEGQSVRKWRIELETQLKPSPSHGKRSALRDVFASMPSVMLWKGRVDHSACVWMRESSDCFA